MAKLSLGLQLGYWGALAPGNHVELAQEAENLGFDSVWTAEAYGNDCFTPLAWIGAHTSKVRLGTSVAQLSARTPAACAMATLSIDHLTGGRMILGLGVSGPQVVEGWYGQPYSKPITRTREYVDIIRKILARQEPVTSDGEFYTLPYKGPGSWGMGKAIKSITHPLRADVPIFIGAEGPKNVTQTAEIADGWLPLYYSPYRQEVYADQLTAAKPGFEIAPTVLVNINNNLQDALYPVKASRSRESRIQESRCTPGHSPGPRPISATQVYRPGIRTDDHGRKRKRPWDLRRWPQPSNVTSARHPGDRRKNSGA